MQITLGQQYNVGEKPTVILYIYINRHVNLTHLLGGQCDVYLTQIRVHLPSACKVSQKCSDAVGLRVR